MKHDVLSFVFLLASALPSAAQTARDDPELVVGDLAPPLSVERWLAGPPVEGVGAGRVTVVEFWAVWCPPCIAGMPHLTELQRKYADRGLSVVGVAPRPDDWGHDLDSIGALLERQGDAVGYSIALDADSGSERGYQGVFRGETIESWMGAARIGAIPIAFVVDREGRIAGIGLPGSLDETVRACLDGTHDIELAAESYRKLLAARDDYARFMALMQAGRAEEATALGWELTSSELWSDARALAGMAERLIVHEQVEDCACLAVRVAERADDLTGHSDPGMIGVHARAHFVNGDFGEGARLAALALGLAQGGLRDALERELAEARAKGRRRFESETTAFTGVTIIDGTGAPPRTDSVLVVTGERIQGVHDVAQWDPPSDCKTVDAKGLFAIPGLWDMHVHLRWTDEASLPLYPILGVTGVRDMGGDFEQIDGWRRSIQTGELLGPRILTPGPMLESPANEAASAGHSSIEDRSRTRIAVGSPEAARAAVARVAAMGADFVKLRTVHDEETYLAIAEAARTSELLLVGHPPWDLDPLVAIEAGQRSFEHGFYPWPLADYDEERSRELFAALTENRVALVPTLIAWESRMFDMEEIEAIADDAQGEIEPRRRYLQPRHVAKWREDIAGGRDEWPTEHEGWRDVLDRHAAEIGRFHRAGVTVLPGSDVCGLLLYPGFSLHDELVLFVERAGMSPMEALQSATLRSTEFLGLDAELGSIEPGKLADVVLLGSDPLASIENVADVRGLVLRGRHFDAERLGELAERVARAAAGK